jgi:hypothetical protein
VYTPARFGDTKPSKQQHFSPSGPQETSILDSNSHLNHSPGIFGMSFNETITISSDSESEIESDAAENGEGSLQCNGAWPSVDTASLYTATAQTDKMSETRKYLDLSCSTWNLVVTNLLRETQRSISWR